MILPAPENKYDRIAFFGPMASGKTFCAQYLIDRYKYQRVSFATKLKAIAAELFQVTGKDNASRRVLQDLGSYVREIQPDAWIKYALMHSYLTGKIVVDDLRYQNEAETLRNEGFTLIRVWAPEEVRKQRINELYPDTGEDALSHSSEMEIGLIEPDFYINSLGTGPMTAQLDYIMSGAYDGSY